MKVKLSEYRLSKNIQSHSNQIQTKHNQTGIFKLYTFLSFSKRFCKSKTNIINKFDTISFKF